MSMPKWTELIGVVQTRHWWEELLASSIFNSNSNSNFKLYRGHKEKARAVNRWERCTPDESKYSLLSLHVNLFLLTISFPFPFATQHYVSRARSIRNVGWQFFIALDWSESEEELLYQMISHEYIKYSRVESEEAFHERFAFLDKYFFDIKFQKRQTCIAWLRLIKLPNLVEKSVSPSSLR